MRAVCNRLRAAGITVSGQPKWIGPSVTFDVGIHGGITLGDECVISEGVNLLTHDYSADRTQATEAGWELYSEEPIVIGANVFLGMNSLLLPGVTIGDDSIIGAGSVVTKTVPHGEVWAGNPARRLNDIESWYEHASSRFTLKRIRP
jgi:acetyltransferase-like isoleucine patch superfamily enzyme